MADEQDILDYRTIALLEEARCALVFAELAQEWRPFAGGTMCRGPLGSWGNAAVGAGLAGPTTREEVRGLIEFYEEKGIEPRAEVSAFADRTLVDALAAEQFVLRHFETVFFRAISRGERIVPVRGWPRGLEIEVVDPADDAAVEMYARTALRGFLPEGMEPSDAFLEVTRAVARHPRSVAILAMVDGQCAGAAGAEFTGEVAAMFGASVNASHRRRGIQQALLAWRLNEAAARGAKVATISSRPGVATERNSRRMGFEQAYTRVVLVRPREGLVGVVE